MVSTRALSQTDIIEQPAAVWNFQLNFHVNALHQPMKKCGDYLTKEIGTSTLSDSMDASSTHFFQ